MAKSMTTSPMTEGQITRACELVRAKLTKHASEFPSDAVQLAFGRSELGAECLAIFSKFVEMFSSMIVRLVNVDGRVKEIRFFRPEPEEYDHDGWMSDDDFEEALARRGLIAADPKSLAKVNEDDPSFAKEHTNGTHWKGADGKWHYVTFNCWGSKRGVHASRYAGVWRDGCWIAGMSCK